MSKQITSTSPGFGAGASRREVLLGASGLAAATTLGGSVAARPGPSKASLPMSGSINDIGTFEILAWSWGASNSGTTHQGGGGGSGNASFQDISFSKYLDETSPLLMEAVALGEILTSATLTVAGAATEIVLELENVLITACSLGGSNGETALTENISINFSRFKYRVNAVETRWDIYRSA